MCGRFAIAITLKDAEREFGIKKINETFTPSYNIAPSQKIPIIWNENGMITLGISTWGLIPHWAKEPKHGYKMINARVETLAEKHTYNKELIEGRCLIHASGFFEWKKKNGSKVPMYIHLKNREAFAFAGISSDWKAPDGKTLKTCSIITTEPNSFMEKIHDRMPALLPKELEKKWIDSGIEDKKEILSMIHPYPAKDMGGYEVSTMVNSPTNNNPNIIKPIKA